MFRLLPLFVFSSTLALGACAATGVRLGSIRGAARFTGVRTASKSGGPRLLAALPTAAARHTSTASISESPPSAADTDIPAPAATILFVADDLGMSDARNRGILEAFQKGVVNRCSVAANSPAAERGLELMRQHGLLDKVGLHINLTEGEPLGAEDEVATLLVPKGAEEAQHDQEESQSHFFVHRQRANAETPSFRGKKWLTDASAAGGGIDPAHVAAEVRAQMWWFIRNVGHLPPHVDGHQHCHVHETTREAVAQVIKEFQEMQGEHGGGIFGVDEKDLQERRIRVRVPFEPVTDDAKRPLCPTCSQISGKADAARAVFQRVLGTSSSNFCDGFVGLSLCGGDYTAADVRDAIEAQLHRLIESGVAEGFRDSAEFDEDPCSLILEVMVHPGAAFEHGCRGVPGSEWCSDSGPWDEFDVDPARAAEMRVLCAEELQVGLNKL